MIIIGIDPGQEESAYAAIDTRSGFPGEIIGKGKGEEGRVISDLYTLARQKMMEDIVVSIEMPASYGMAVGRSVFDTCAQVGRFEIALREFLPLTKPALRMYRKAKNDQGIPSICSSICKNNRAGDSNIRQAIIDLYPASGGGKIPQIGTKKQPGALHGVSKDIWAALAVALTYQMWEEKK